MTQQNFHNGFTLVEMSIVLVIIALLVGGLLTPLSTQKELEKRADNAALLEQAREALIGYALINTRLPCPDTTGNGLEDAPCPNNPGPPTGRLPWITLDIDSEWDAWGEPHQVNYVVNGAFTASITLNSAGAGVNAIDIHTTTGSCNTANNLVATNVPALIWSTAKTDYTLQAPARVDEQDNANGDHCYVYRDYSTILNQEFDDQLVWLSDNILFNRMVSAGVLP
ncbi:MAG TPA: type II secretion system protein [Gammaproteobacteria bacterium]|nr:type II secretion system protein [Gammaproteobacteria bacterium]